MTSNRRFRIALSFAGEKRLFVSEVATILSKIFGRDEILYDKFHEAEFARRDLAFHLPDLYAGESDLVVAVLCKNYEQKEWCGLEWDAIFDLLKHRKDNEVMLCRFDKAVTKGLRSIAGYLELDDVTPLYAAQRILERLAINEHKSKQFYLDRLTDTLDKNGTETRNGSDKIKLGHVALNSDLTVEGGIENLVMCLDEARSLSGQEQSNVTVDIAGYSNLRRELAAMHNAGICTDEQRRQAFGLRKKINEFDQMGWNYPLDDLAAEAVMLANKYFKDILPDIEDIAYCICKYLEMTAFPGRRAAGTKFDFFREDLDVYFAIYISKDDAARLAKSVGASQVEWLTRIWGLDPYHFFSYYKDQVLPGMLFRYLILKYQNASILDPQEYFAIDAWNVGLG